MKLVSERNNCLERLFVDKLFCLVQTDTRQIFHLMFPAVLNLEYVVLYHGELVTEKSCQQDVDTSLPPAFSLKRIEASFLSYLKCPFSWLV